MTSFSHMNTNRLDATLGKEAHARRLKQARDEPRVHLPAILPPRDRSSDGKAPAAAHKKSVLIQAKKTTKSTPG